jgi:hypothetical protein
MIYEEITGDLDCDLGLMSRVLEPSRLPNRNERVQETRWYRRPAEGMRPSRRAGQETAPPSSQVEARGGCSIWLT